MVGSPGQINQTPLVENDFKAILALGQHRGPDSSYSNFGFGTKAIEEMLNSHIREHKDNKWPHLHFMRCQGINFSKV